MTTNDFLGRLKGVQSTGDGSWVACCPAHGDEHPSMSVTERDGKILVHCHAGCSAADIVGSLGLKLADLFTEKRTGDFVVDKREVRIGDVKPAAKAKRRSPGKWICDYLYHDENGTLLYKASRYLCEDGKKTFTIAHRDETQPSGWAYGLRDVGLPRVIYHLPDVLNAGKSGGTVVIAEGEKDVDNLRALGYCATCNVGGAGKWGYCFPEDWGKWFDGVKKVLIIADNDPATKAVKRYDRHLRKHVEDEKPFLVGQKHAWSVHQALRAAGFSGSIKLMVMQSVCEAHVKDFTDWLEAIRAKNGVSDVKSERAAFQQAVLESAAWPDAWRFDEETEKETAPRSSGSRETPVDDDAPASAACGRFGRWIPRAPTSDRDVYEVSFDVGSGLNVLLEFARGMTIQAMTAHAIASVSAKCPGGDIPKGVVPRLKSWTAAVWLLMRGSFFWNLDSKTFARCMFLDRDERSCKLMMIESDEFYAFLADAARLDDVDPKKGDLGKIMGVVKQIAVSDDYATGVTPSNLWDRRGDVVYVSSGDTQMYRLKDGAVELVQNGTDGVVFLRGKTLAPWTIVDGAGTDPFAEALIFKGASWEDAKHGPLVARTWVLSLFACPATKPPLLITGKAGSGKTRMAKAVKEILGVRTDGQLDLSVQLMEAGDKGLDAFWATVNEGRLEVFDNLDTKIAWASDTLQTAATDGQTKRRTLYTTYGVSILKARAFLIFTSNNPVLATEGNGGMADRLITIRLAKNRAKSMDRQLSQDIAENRDAFMTWMVRTVAKALTDKAPVDDAVNTRHPDFGEFAIRCGRALGIEADVVEALGSVEVDKLLLPLQNDIIMREVLAVLEVKAWEFKFTSGEMTKAILARMGDEADEKSAQMFSARRVGKALAKYASQLCRLLHFTGPKMVNGYSIYEVTGQRVSFSSVGLVGLDWQSRKSAGEEHAQEFTENAHANPLNPLDARAGAGDLYPFTREDRENIEEEDDNDLNF